MHPAGGLGVSPRFKKSPKIGGYRGLIETISAVSILRMEVKENGGTNMSGLWLCGIRLRL